MNTGNPLQNNWTSGRVIRGWVLLVLLLFTLPAIQSGILQQSTLSYAQMSERPEAKKLWLNRSHDQWSRFQQRPQEPVWQPAPPPLWQPITMVLKPGFLWVAQARGPPHPASGRGLLCWYCRNNADPG